jgi:hypothetical protein
MRRRRADGVAVSMRGLQLANSARAKYPSLASSPRRHMTPIPSAKQQISVAWPHAGPCAPPSGPSIGGGVFPARVLTCSYPFLDLCPLGDLGWLSYNCRLGAKEVLQSQFERILPRYLSMSCIVWSQRPGPEPFRLRVQMAVPHASWHGRTGRSPGRLRSGR